MNDDLPLERESNDLPMTLLSDGTSAGPEDDGTRCTWCGRRWLGCGPCPACRLPVVAERNCSHVGGWRKCAECGRETWDTENGLCIRCRPAERKR